MVKETALYGSGELTLQYVRIQRASFENHSTRLPDGQGVMSGKPNLSVIVEASVGYGNMLTIPYEQAIQLVAATGTSEGLPVGQQRDVPALSGLAVIVLYDGRSPKSIALAQDVGQELLSAFADDIRDGLSKAAKRGLRAARRTAADGLTALVDLLGENRR